jgi:signal peptidase I
MLCNMIHAIRRLLFGRHLYRTLMRAGVLGILCVALCQHVVRPSWTEGSSMEPTVRDGRLHFINLLAYRKAGPARGEVVTISSATGSFLYLKRILGLPGERVAFDQGQLLVNGHTVDEPYVVREGAWTMPPITLGKDQYFVAGDNRSAPRDDHMHGVVQRRMILGRLIL